MVLPAHPTGHEPQWAYQYRQKLSREQGWAPVHERK